MVRPAPAGSARIDSPSGAPIVATAPLEIRLPQKGINYLSLWHLYSPDYLTDEVLDRDFSRFKNDGIEYISLSLHWFRLEGDTRGDFTGSRWYGDAFLANVKRIIEIADRHGIKTMVTIHTFWGDDSVWATPRYVLDPETGLNDGLAVVRSREMRQAFIEMFAHAVEYLKGTPGIWSWALNEPWYPPDTAVPPSDNTSVKENFVTLFREISGIVKSVDGRPFTVRFVSAHDNGSTLQNLFVENWAWDERMLSTLDFISFDPIPSECSPPSLRTGRRSHVRISLDPWHEGRRCGYRSSGAITT